MSNIRLTKLFKHPLFVGIGSAIVSTLLTLFVSTKPAFDQSAQQSVSRAITAEAARISNLAGSVNGFIVGEIRAFAFDGETFEGMEYRRFTDELQKTGWLECRGQSMAQKIYPDLYAKVGARWGRIDDTTVRFPDLRGTFLRGWNHGSKTSDANGDPDVPARTESVDGQQKDRVGSAQPGALQVHVHKERATFPNYQDPGQSPQMIHSDRPDEATARSQTGPPAPSPPVTTSEFETRPKNKYVLYCIYSGVKA